MMSSKPMNMVFILSDEHNKEMLGCYGHPVVKTPNLDSLAEHGVRFSNAYCNSPICVPSRASMATGRYVHKIDAWDNATPYTGTLPSWGHRLTEQGYHVTTIGKLHYRDDGDNTGFPDKRLSLHVQDGVGDIYSLIREDMDPRPQNRQKILEAGPGESSYTRYDRGIADAARRFLQEEAPYFDKPWVLFVSFVSPHFPLIAPQEYFDMYPLESVIFPKQYSMAERSMHPVLEEYRRVWDTSDEFDESAIRKAVAAYYGLCSFLDDQVGTVLRTIKETGLEETTRIIYASDHGDTLGDHGVWFKSTMYEGSVGVPFIMAGPDLPKGKVMDNHISLVDCFPTLIEAVGARLTEEDGDLPGTSLLPMARGESKKQRTVFSEYHAMGAVTGVFMIRQDRYKYVYYVGYRPQLFDLKEDPNELNDLADNPAYQDILAACERELRTIANPEEIDRLAREDQARRIAEHGGRANIIKEGLKIAYSPVPQQFRDS
jgi:choline-sulfatase